MSLLNSKGNLGLIATNTVAQGDTRQIGLRQMVKDDAFTITRAIQSRHWPVASANLEYSAVWGTRDTIAVDIPRIADDMPVPRISSMLEPGEDVDPLRLAKNTGTAFKGCESYGLGFILEPEEAKSWIEADPRNAEVLFPYLNAVDLNSRPNVSASRWTIDFNRMLEPEARTYPLPYQRLLERVKPERAKKARDVREAPWWLFWRARPTMREAIAKLDEMLIIARVSKTVMPVRIRTDLVPSDATVVFATDSFADQAVLSSSVHQMWAIKYGSGMRNDPRYTPSTIFETFPRPEPTGRLAEIGRRLDIERREIMLRRDLGLTKLYNLANDSDITDSSDDDIARIRKIHVELDRAVMDAYGWSDVELDHGFHTYRQMQRWTVSPAARVEILDRLLAENLKRAEVQGEAPPPADDEEEGDDE